MKRSRPFGPILASMLAFGPGAGQADPPRGPAVLVEESDLLDDPLGLGETVDLDQIPAERAPTPPAPGPIDKRFGPPPPDVDVTEGEVLTGVQSIRERAHHVNITLRDGLAFVEVTLELASQSRRPTEARYRLATPPATYLTRLEVCAGERCRTGVPSDGPGAYNDAVRARGPAHALPVAHASEVEDERGHAIVVHAAPIPPRGVLTVRVGYAVRAPMHGGRVRLRLPARGTDPRAAPLTARVTAEGLLSPLVNGRSTRMTPATADPWEALSLVATAPSHEGPTARVARVRCGDRVCARFRVAAGPAPGRPAALVLLIDASPSMRGPARGRVAVALAGLLGASPEGTTVRALAFAAVAEEVLGETSLVERAPLVPLVEAANRELGSATRFEAAWDKLAPWLEDGPKPELVWIGDGGVTSGDDATRAFEALGKARVRVHHINVSDRPTASSLRERVTKSGGVVLEVGREAAEAQAGEGTSPLEERLGVLFAPLVMGSRTVTLGRTRIALPALRAGEEVVREIVISGFPRRIRFAGRALRVADARELGMGALLASLARERGVAGAAPLALSAVAPGDLSLAHLCGPLGPATRASGVSRDDAPVVLAQSRSCRSEAPTDGTPPSPANSLRGRGMPARIVRGMLRQRVIPVARACFRRERAGRLRHSARALYRFRMAEREIVSARVEGRLPEELRRCLLSALDALDIPRFRGAVEVSYPLYTKPHEEAPREELAPGLADRIDKVFGGEPTVTPLP